MVAVEFVGTGALVLVSGALVATGGLFEGTSLSTASSTTGVMFVFVVDGKSWLVLSISVGVGGDQGLMFWAREYCFWQNK